MTKDLLYIDCEEGELLWLSEAGTLPPRRVISVDDTTSADQAYRLACEGCGLLWRGDFQNAKQLLQAMSRRFEKNQARKKRTPAQSQFPEAFHQHRMAQAQRARILGCLLVPVSAGHQLTLRRAPDVREVCRMVWADVDCAYVVSLRELLGLIGAYEWNKKGVRIAALNAVIYPQYGVFSPVRGEYIDLVAAAPLPQALKEASVAFDIGTGTGVLAAVLAKRGVARIVATDQDQRALECAARNFDQLGIARQVELQKANLFPEGKAPLIVCNPPWLPGKPSAPIEYAIYDPASAMLRGFLAGLGEHLCEGGEGWLIISDFAEHLKLRSREQLLAWFSEADLVVLGREDVRPVHPKAFEQTNPLFLARAAEVTSLWRLGKRVKAPV